ncbi:MAG TPA: hypothetical protein VF696_00410 [Candidatus Paceibacterota bacterium]
MEIVQQPILPVRECIRYAWETFKKQPLLFALAILVVDGIGFLLEYLSLGVTLAQPGTIAVIVVLGLLAFALQAIVMTNFVLRAHDAPEQVGYGDIFRPARFWKLIGTMLLSIILIIIGLILLIVPGVILGIMFAFAGFIAVDKGLSPVAALKHSAAITKGNRSRIFGLLVLLLIAALIVGLVSGVAYWVAGDIVSRILQFLGDIVLLPVLGLSLAHAYRLLDAAHMTELGAATPVAPVLAAEAPVPAVIESVPEATRAAEPTSV